MGCGPFNQPAPKVYYLLVAGFFVKVSSMKRMGKQLSELSEHAKAIVAPQIWERHGIHVVPELAPLEVKLEVVAYLTERIQWLEATSVANIVQHRHQAICSCRELIWKCK